MGKKRMPGKKYKAESPSGASGGHEEFPHFKPLVNVPKMYRLQVIYINQLRKAVSDDQDTIFLILFFSTAGDASHGQIKC